jgi:hypothetical protein
MLSTLSSDFSYFLQYPHSGSVKTAITRDPSPRTSLTASARRKAFQLKYGMSDNELSDAKALALIPIKKAIHNRDFFTLVLPKIDGLYIALHDALRQQIEYSAI